jgi:hypothetical protein
MGKVKSFQSFNENVSSTDLEDIKNILNIASDVDLTVDVYEIGAVCGSIALDSDLTLTVRNHVRNPVDNKEVCNILSEVIRRIDFLCQERAFEMTWKIHLKYRPPNKRNATWWNVDDIVSGDDERMKSWADKGYPAWGLNGIGEIQGLGIYLNKIKVSRLDMSKLVDGSDNPEYGLNEEATYIPCNITEADVTDIEMILNLAYDDGVKVLLQADKQDDLTTINRIDLVNQDNQLTDTEFNHVVANIYQRLCDVGVFRGYKEFQTTATAEYNDDDFDYNDDDDEEPLGGDEDEEWGGEDAVDNLGPAVSFRAVSIFRKIRRKGIYEAHNFRNLKGLSTETMQDVNQIITIATDADEEIEINTYSSTVQFIYPFDYQDKYNREGYDNFKEISNDITNRLINLGIVKSVIFYTQGGDEESVVPPDRWHMARDEFPKIEIDLIKKYLESDDEIFNDIAIELDDNNFIQDLPPEERINEASLSNPDDQEIQQVLNIARDEDLEVHCTDTSSVRSIRIKKSGEMTNEEFFQMCVAIDERLVDIGTFREGVVFYKGIGGTNYNFLSELESQSRLQANIKEIYDYTNATVSTYPAGMADKNRKRDLAVRKVEGFDFFKKKEKVELTV